MFAAANRKAGFCLFGLAKFIDLFIVLNFKGFIKYFSFEKSIKISLK